VYQNEPRLLSGKKIDGSSADLSIAAWKSSVSAGQPFPIKLDFLAGLPNNLNLLRFGKSAVLQQIESFGRFAVSFKNNPAST
jgi:hypothetical protein